MELVNPDPGTIVALARRTASLTGKAVVARHGLPVRKVRVHGHPDGAAAAARTVHLALCVNGPVSLMRSGMYSCHQGHPWVIVPLVLRAQVNPKVPQEKGLPGPGRQEAVSLAFENKTNCL